MRVPMRQLILRVAAARCRIWRHHSRSKRLGYAPLSSCAAAAAWSATALNRGDCLTSTGDRGHSRHGIKRLIPRSSPQQRTPPPHPTEECPQLGGQTLVRSYCRSAPRPEHPFQAALPQSGPWMGTNRSSDSDHDCSQARCARS